MTISDNPSPKPNDTIFLEDTIITHIEDQCLPEPCSVRVVIRLLPTIKCCIYSDDFPMQLVNSIYSPFTITLENGCKIDVMFSKIFKQVLTPCKCPCTVVQEDTRIRSVSFSILNFQEFSGQKDKWIVLNEEFQRLGVVEMRHGDWQIKITEDPAFYKNKKLLNQYDGYAVTHTGIIQRCNGEIFCVKEAEHLLRGLRAFLSFARGSACGLTLAKAVDKDNREVVLEWGTTHTEPWGQGGITWLPNTDRGDSLSQLFSGFWSLYDDSDWRDTICTVIDWYLNSNNGPFHVGIILAQAALESICHKIVGNTTKKSERPEIFLRTSLKKIGINNAIPESFQDLQNFSTQKVRQRRGQDRYRGDGPEAIIEIRNDLVHKEKRYGRLSVEVQVDALRLSLWYVEVILLRKFEYCGQYMNRLRIADENPFENVPWVNGQS